MSFRPSRYYGNAGTTSGYNNPEIGQAASSLGKMFSGVPQASDVLAAEQAKAKAAEASRLAEMFAYAKDPSYSRTQAERYSFATGQSNGTNGYYAQDQNNATSIANNNADNARALKQTALMQQGENIRSVTAPLSEGQTRAPGLGKFFGAPEMPENTRGVVKLNEGQVASGPGGFTAAGTPKPLNESEVKAQVLAGLPEADRRATVMSSVGVETAQGPDGKPVFVNRSDAAGMQPQGPDVSARVTNYGTPDGKRGIAVPDRDGKMRDAQTGAELPPQAQIFYSQAAGSPDVLGGKSTEAQDRYAMALKMTDEPTQIINDAFATGKLPTGGDDAIRALSNVAPGAVGTFISQQMSLEAQSFHNAIKNAVPYQLLALSGQGVTEAEYERTMARMIPFANDTPGVKAQKRNQFNAFRDAIRGLAGPAAAKVGMVAPTAGPSPVAGGGAQTIMPPLNAPVAPAQQGQQAAAAGTAAAAGIGEGTIIENDAGQRMVRRGGKWEPL